MAEVWRVRDYQGREVVLTGNSMDHIRQRHSDMLNRLDAVAEAIAAPVVVTRSRLLSRGENHYGRYRDRFFVRVSVLYRPTQAGWVGEVVTAHLVAAVPVQEDQLWP